MTRSRLLRYVASVTTAALIAALSIGSAFAHTNVAESDPADGASVDSAPARVTVRFGQEAVPAPGQVSDAYLHVLDACGVQVDGKDSTLNVQDSSVTVSSGGDTSGRYEIHWYATAADGAVQTGVLDFNVRDGEPCTKVARPDAADDTEGGPDVTTIRASRTRRGGRVTLRLNDAITCAALGPKAEEHLSMFLDTDSDRDADLTGAVLCKRGRWSLKLTSAEGENTGALAVTQPDATTLRVLIPAQKLVAHVDVWVEASSEAPECDGKVCFDRAPDLGLVRGY